MPVRRQLVATLAAALLVASLAQGCAREEGAIRPATRAAPVVPLDTGTVWITTAADSFSLSVEIAETSDQTQIGLMERYALPEDEGMIFLFDDARSSGFWMFRTRIPLDIAYLDEAGRIVATAAMQPCASPYAAPCPRYAPGADYTAALEVSEGYFAARGIRVGDRVRLRRAGGGWPATGPPGDRAPVSEP